MAYAFVPVTGYTELIPRPRTSWAFLDSPAPRFFSRTAASAEPTGEVRFSGDSGGNAKALLPQASGLSSALRSFVFLIKKPSSF